MHPAEAFSLIVGLFLAAVLLHHAASLLRVPPSVTLLVGGGALAFVPGLPVIELDPELILSLERALDLEEYSAASVSSATGQR